MRPQTQEKLDRIRRVSGALRMACKVALVVIALLFVAASVGIAMDSGVSISFPDVLVPVTPLLLTGRLILTLVLAASMGVIVKGLYHLDQLFGCYSRGEIFSKHTARQIRQLGITSLVWAGVNILSTITLAVLMHASVPLRLHLDAVFIGLAIIAISWFMDAAAEMREENELTI